MSTITGNVTGAASAEILTQEEANAQQSLSSEEFMSLLLAEIQNQNPLEPMKNNEMLEQMSAIKNLEATDALTRQLSQLTEQSKVGEAAGLIGKAIRGESTAGVETVGVVQGVLVEDDVVHLVVDGAKVPYENVVEVADVSAVAAADGKEEA